MYYDKEQESYLYPEAGQCVCSFFVRVNCFPHLLQVTVDMKHSPNSTAHTEWQSLLIVPVPTQEHSSFGLSSSEEYGSSPLSATIHLIILEVREVNWRRIWWGSMLLHPSGFSMVVIISDVPRNSILLLIYCPSVSEAFTLFFLPAWPSLSK